MKFGRTVCADLAPLDTSGIEYLPTGAMVAPVVLTWTGVRPYLINGRVLRALRRPEQVFSPSHVRTLRLLTPTSFVRDEDDAGAHPYIINDAGERLPVLLQVGAGGEVDDDGFVRLPPEQFSVGSTGDEITERVVHGYRMPTGRVKITDPRTIRAIRDEKLTQVSLGYVAMRMAPPDDELVVGEDGQPTGEGSWIGPHGPEIYDFEHVLDLDDSRMQPQALVDAGHARDLDDAEVLRGEIGGNHIALALRAGRGGPGVDVITARDQATPPTITPARDAWDGPRVMVCMDAIALDPPPGACIDAPDTAASTGARTKGLDSAPSARASIAQETDPETDHMKTTLARLLPRLAVEADSAPVFKSALVVEIDASPAVMEALAMLEKGVMEYVAKLKTALGEAEGGMKAAEEAKAEMEAMNGAGEEKMAAMKADLDRALAERDAALETLRPIVEKRDAEAVLLAARVAGVDEKDPRFAPHFKGKTPAQARRAAVKICCKISDASLLDSEMYVRARFDALLAQQGSSTATTSTTTQTSYASGFGAGLQHEANRAPIADSADPGQAEADSILKRLH